MQQIYLLKNFSFFLVNDGLIKTDAKKKKKNFFFNEFPSKEQSNIKKSVRKRLFKQPAGVNWLFCSKHNNELWIGLIIDLKTFWNPLDEMFKWFKSITQTVSWQLPPRIIPPPLLVGVKVRVGGNFPRGQLS